MGEIVVGHIEPKKFSADEGVQALSAVTRAQAEAMANAAQDLWTQVRLAEPARLDRIRLADRPIGELLLKVRGAMK